MTPTDTTAAANWHIANLDSPVDGVPIRFGVYRPKQKKPSRAVLLLNGRSEWIEKYAEVPDWIQLSDDILWVTLDHRGQGDSGGARAFVAHYDDYAADAASVMEAVAEDLPYAIISHSMGGLVALHGTLRGQLKPVALGLCSPLLAMPNSPLPRKIARPLSRVVSKTVFRQQPTGIGSQKKHRFAGNHLTSSFTGFGIVRGSPYLFISPTFGWIEATFDACDRVFDPETLKKLQVPVRIIGGSQEQVIDPAGWSSWCMEAAHHTQAPIEFYRVSQGRHELLNEIPRVRNQTIALLKGWLQKYLSPQAPE